MTRRLASLLLALLLGQACGGGTSTSGSASVAEAVRTAQRSIANRESGQIEFVFTARVDESEPVGFEIEGDYEFDDDRDLAVLDLTYRQILGEESIETEILSTGEEAWVVVDGEPTKLAGEHVAPLKMDSSRESRAVPQLDIASWLREGEVEEQGTRSTVTGEVRASALIADLQQLAAQVAGGSGDELDEATAKQIDDAVDSSEMRIESRKNSLVALTAAVDFGAEVPPGLREALGPYAAARLELAMRVKDIAAPLRVSPPT